MNDNELSEKFGVTRDEIHTPWWRIALAILFGLGLLMTMFVLTGTVQTVGAMFLGFLGIGAVGGLHLVVVREAEDQREWATFLCAILNLGSIFVIGYGITVIWNDFKNTERLVLLAAIYHFGSIYYHRQKKKK